MQENIQAWRLPPWGQKDFWNKQITGVPQHKDKNPGKRKMRRGREKVTRNTVKVLLFQNVLLKVLLTEPSGSIEKTGYIYIK